MTFTVTYRGADGAMRDEFMEAAGLRPCGRAGYCAPFRRPERFGKSASFGETLRNVAVERRVAAKFVADAGLRIEDKHRDLDSVADDFHHRCDIGIAGNKRKAVRTMLVCIAEHVGGNVHIRHLFRNPKDLYTAISSPVATGTAWLAGGQEQFQLFTVSPFNYLHERLMGQGVKVLVLPFRMPMVFRFVDDARCEILDCDNLMILTMKLAGKCQKVKPFVGSPSKLAVVEIGAIYVNDCLFHTRSSKVQEPDLRPAPRRLPESWRVKVNLLSGSARIVANRGCGCNRDNEKIFNGEFFRRAA